MATVGGSLRSTLLFTQTPGNVLIGGVPVAVPLSLVTTLGSGTLADAADLLYAVRLPFVASTTQTLDLTALTDVLGGTVSFARVRAIAVKILSTTDTATLTLGNAASNPWAGFLSATGTLTIQAASATNPDGAWFVLTAPNTTGMVTSGTSKSLKFLPSAHAFSADVVIIGCSV